MRILIINIEVPFPPIGGRRLRTYHLLRFLASKHDITLVGFTYDGETEFLSPPFPVNVICVPWQMPPLYADMHSNDPITSQRAYEILYEIDQPWFVSYFESSAMAATLREVSQDPFDLILIEDTDIAQFLPFLPPYVPKILDFHNVYTLLTQREVEGKTGVERDHATWEAERTLRFEKEAASQCQLCITCSIKEASAVKTMLGMDHVEVVPNGVDTTFFTPSEATTNSDYLLFTGTMSSPYNIEAVQFFAVNILPLIREKIPKAELHIVGQKPSKEVLSLASDSVHVQGAVSDVRPFFREAQVYVVPLLYGGGTRLRILEAAACGKAIVTTSIGAEGLDFIPGKDLMVADSPTEFSKAVIELIENEDKRKDLEQRARQVSRNYDWEKIGSAFLRLIEEYADQET